jgi:hypothetical protein
MSDCFLSYLKIFLYNNRLDHRISTIPININKINSQRTYLKVAFRLQYAPLRKDNNIKQNKLNICYESFRIEY